MSADHRDLLPKTFAVIDGMVKAGTLNDGDWAPIDSAMREKLLNDAARRIVEFGKRNGAPMTKAARYGHEWRDKNPHKVAANTDAYAAIKNGSLVREPCEYCGASVDVQAHHPDYSKPLEVVWLCRSCHAKEHKAA